MESFFIKDQNAKRKWRRRFPGAIQNTTAEACLLSLLAFFAHQVLDVAVVFLADVLKDFLIGIPGGERYDAPGLRVIVGVVDGRFDAKRVGIACA